MLSTPIASLLSSHGLESLHKLLDIMEKYYLQSCDDIGTKIFNDSPIKFSGKITISELRHIDENDKKSRFFIVSVSDPDGFLTKLRTICEYQFCKPIDAPEFRTLTINF